MDVAYPAYTPADPNVPSPAGDGIPWDEIFGLREKAEAKKDWADLYRINIIVGENLERYGKLHEAAAHYYSNIELHENPEGKAALEKFFGGDELREERARAYAIYALACRKLRQYKRAEEYYSLAIRTTQNAAVWSPLIEMLFQVCMDQMAISTASEVLVRWEAALNKLNEQSAGFAWARLYTCKADVLGHQGKYREAQVAAETACEYYKELNETQQPEADKDNNLHERALAECHLRKLLAVLHERKGNFEKAEQLLTQNLSVARSISEDTQNRSLIGAMQHELGALYLSMNRLEDSEKCLDAALIFQVGDPVQHAVMLKQLATVKFLMFKFDMASRVFERASAAHLRFVGDKDKRTAECLFLQASCLLAKPNVTVDLLKDLSAIYDKAMSIARGSVGDSDPLTKRIIKRALVARTRLRAEKERMLG